VGHFRWALSKTLHHEGGFIDHPSDPGGATYRGISLRFLRAEGEDINADGDIDLADIQALVEQPEVVDGLYREHFWKPNRLDEVPSELLACKIFDMCVNMGSRQAWKLVQRASGRLKDDGIVGAKTIEYLVQSSRTDYDLIGKIRGQQAKFYTDLIKQKPHLATFATGWMRRAAQ
jgi:lysozyme family protein